MKILQTKSDLNFWPDALLPASVFVIGGLWGGYLIYRDFSKRNFIKNAEGIQPKTDQYRFRFNFFKEGVSGRWIYSGLLTTYLMSVVSVVILAFFLQITLPYVWYESTVAQSEGSKRQGSESGEAAGRLLSHSGGYWHLVSHPICKSSAGTAYKDLEGYEEYYHRSIMAIPDKNGVDVEVVNPN